MSWKVLLHLMSLDKDWINFFKNVHKSKVSCFKDKKCWRSFWSLCYEI